MRSLCLLILLLVACMPSYRNPSIGSLGHAEVPVRLRAKVNVKGWRVNSSGVSGAVFEHTDNDPEIMPNIERQIGRSLEKTGLIRAVDDPRDADILIETEISLRGIADSDDSSALAFACKYFLIPALTGFPCLRVDYNAKGKFVLSRPGGKVILEHRYPTILAEASPRR